MTDTVAVATSLRSTETHLVVITTSSEHAVAWEQCSPLLAQATPLERAAFRLSPSGYGIHWPLIDEDLAVGLLLATAR